MDSSGISWNESNLPPETEAHIPETALHIRQISNSRSPLSHSSEEEQASPVTLEIPSLHECLISLISPSQLLWRLVQAVL